MTEEVNVVVGVIIRNDKILIAKRNAKQHQGGLWEFPGGKVDAGESEVEALARELNEELGIDINPKACQKRQQIHHQYPDKAVNLNIYWVSDFTGIEQAREGQPLKWITKSQLADYPFPEANQPILDELRSEH
ncbi:8-oxo-dGTP diphosphatase MutT [Celerinatantimonas diazotrophica]|uniref:8-oxo-dGTP diphosphatase n=1 Tax=Celerinatantimonas diazotrophica TaxID=412034 RepID=A0A4R1K2P8_9GAMM|nr:8-oxo-dGTP diphosphatase MutT [Celerinatantimonas diazotrophica]TCK57973.1 8-oxo-dGTPase [Celerinatantimonas diazotrophica]CAG9297958.1 CTP pyrophosphohydrolase [Celerinatantimonas diazotrophica]